MVDICPIKGMACTRADVICTATQQEVHEKRVQHPVAVEQMAEGDRRIDHQDVGKDADEHGQGQFDEDEALFAGKGLLEGSPHFFKYITHLRKDLRIERQNKDREHGDEKADHQPA